jgi:polyribonucleotide nucleotidyltransferase
VQVHRVERPIGSLSLSLETGKIAKQAHGAVVVRLGDTMTLSAVVEGEDNPERDFFPLTVDYREKVYSAGKFPGGFIKREGRPTTKEILTCRLIDRPIRPLFPSGYQREVQVMTSVRSFDKENDPDILCMIGASAALHISEIPFTQPTGSVRVGRVNGQFVLMPTHQQMEESDLDLIVAGTRSAITMIEGFAREMKEDEMAAAIAFGHDGIRDIIEMIEELREKMGKPAKSLPLATPNPAYEDIRKRYYDEFKKRKSTPGKLERAAAIKELKDRIIEENKAVDPPPYSESSVKSALSALEERIVRDAILEGVRIDGRTAKEVRPLYCEVAVWPRTHGSAIFQRGETQAVVSVTLGTVSDEQRVDGLMDEFSKKFMLDYNMPPYAVGECRRIQGPGRREIGHGMLAERSLKAIIPSPEEFPYTIRLVSEIEESNGSSSMASVCGGTLALMDAGVPIYDPVAGVSIGLVKEGERYTILTDIMGDEDHYGDMDFKVAGTVHGITGIQLDLKIDGIDEKIIRETLDQAREARREILRFMLKATPLQAPRAEISRVAPRLLTVKINPEKIGALIGPGGKNIKAIQESTGAQIDIEDDGTVFIKHANAEGAESARAKVEAITEEVKIGRVYEGEVVSIRDFGAFIQLAPGRDALCHISELADTYVGRVEDVVKLGDRIAVKVIAIDDQNRVKVSRKALLRDQNPPGEGGEGGDGPGPTEEQPPRRERSEEPRREHREGGGRGGERRGGGDRGGRGRGGERRDGGRRGGGGGRHSGDRPAGERPAPPEHVEPPPEREPQE